MKMKLLLGTIIIFTLTILAVFAPLLAKYDPNVISIDEALLAPSSARLFGTDQLGRDLFSRMLFSDIMLCFPAFFLILAIAAVLEPSMLNIILVIGLTGWMGVVRLVRAEILSLKEREFILAARAIGGGNPPVILC